MKHSLSFVLSPCLLVGPLLFILSVDIVLLVSAQSTGPVDFKTHPDYKSWEFCVQYSLAGSPFNLQTNIEPIEGVIQCENIPCLCAPDTLATNLPGYNAAVSAICQEVGSNGRMGGEKASSALDDYCNLNGYTERAAEATTPTKPGTAKATTTAKPKPTPNSDATGIDNSGGEPISNTGNPTPTPAAKDNGLNTGAIIGLVIGGIALLATIVIGVLSIKYARRYGKGALATAVKHPMQTYRVKRRNYGSREEIRWTGGPNDIPPLLADQERQHHQQQLQQHQKPYQQYSQHQQYQSPQNYQEPQHSNQHQGYIES